ncbi:MAG: polysaccharide deacetylase [Salaquimonas sp.]|nr:polysaccharide deacetylase [Salaquimonas sp.]
MTETAWAEVTAELERWRAAGQSPRLFLRDDDAVTVTPALEQLVETVHRFKAPLLLAAIPARADDKLGLLVRDDRRIIGAVHGWAHVSHAPIGEKPCEIGGHRPLETVLNELRQGRQKLIELFGWVSDLLVPPWNRIEDTVLEHIPEAGFGGVSAHGWPDRKLPARQVNTHVDIVHWSGGGVGRDTDWIFAELAGNLAEARRHGFRAVGVLTHHLAHDDRAWETLEDLMERMAGEGANWVHADSLLAEAEAPHRPAAPQGTQA